MTDQATGWTIEHLDTPRAVIERMRVLGAALLAGDYRRAGFVVSRDVLGEIEARMVRRCPGAPASFMGIPLEADDSLSPSSFKWQDVSDDIKYSFGSGEHYHQWPDSEKDFRTAAQALGLDRAREILAEMEVADGAKDPRPDNPYFAPRRNLTASEMLKEYGYSPAEKALGACRAMVDQIAEARDRDVDALYDETMRTVGGWRPMDTAPRDGTEVQLLMSDFAEITGFWRAFPWDDEEFSWRVTSQGATVLWVTDGLVAYKTLGGLRVPYPTHWKPVEAEPTRSKYRDRLQELTDRDGEPE